MTFRIVTYFLFCVGSFVSGITIFGPQPRIISQDGHLIFYAAEHKNITLQTHGRGGIHVNGIDLAKAAKISNSAFEAMKKYKTSFENSFEKMSRFEQLLDGDNGLAQKIIALQSGSRNVSEVPVNVPSVLRSIRRVSRRVNSLQTQVRALTMLLNNNECASNPCKNGGTCQDLFNGFICQCTTEWEGSLCDKDVNECARFAGTDLGCQNGATCINRQGSYECLCPHGWFGLHCTRRSTDCNSGSNAELCGHGICVTQYHDVAGYKCICDQGWTTDGRSPACNTDVNECEMKKHPCSVNPFVQCVNLPGSFHCASCPPGYSGNGYYCKDIDECAQNNGGCSVNPMVQCVNTLGSRICGNCPAGYTGDGVSCSYEGACNVNNGGCHRLATCRNNPRISTTFVECVCPAGYIGSGVGPNGCIRSLQPIGPCAPNPCRHGICRPNGTDYTCDCYRRYTGRNCESFKNLCASNPCQNGGTCTSYLGMSYRCSCPSSYTGLRCEEEKQACGGRLQTESGVLIFPSGIFQNYGNSISCAWTIETNVSNVLNITFKRFNVESSRTCQYDWLQIHDGKNTLARSIGRFCGHNLPNGGVIISTHNIVYLWFRSDHSVSGEGFELNWTSIVPFCGAELKQVTSHGTIQSPGSPGNYPNNRDCYWPLTASPGKRLLFHFFTLMIGNDSNCDHDYLEFISGTVSTDPAFAKFCNTSHPSPLFSLGPEVLVHFHSDNAVNYPGFQITYSVVEAIPGCGGVYTRHQGEIRSPSYNGNYPNDVLCEYKIQLGTKSRIKLTFISFALEDSDGCQFDYVSIHAGSTSDDPLINKYCGTDLPSTYISENNVILIVFKTDWATSDAGFVLKYETVCGGKFTESTGILETPGYPDRYEHNMQCFYEIAQPLGTVIKLKFLDINLEKNSYSECIYDYIEVRDGSDENSTLIGTYCERPPPLIVSSYNYLWLKFESDSNTNGRGFQANYTTTKLGCGGILKEKSGTISSPNYPDVYPSGTICKWIISAPPGNIIQVVWMNFQLEPSHECTYDYVEIFENNTETGTGTSIGKYCGQNKPPTMLSTSNIITIVFCTDNTFSLEGFLATYTFMTESNVCGGNYYSSAGVLKSPNYPNEYPTNMECSWTIHVKPGHQILLNVTDFELESYSACRYDWLEIRNGASAVSPLLGRYCGTNIPKLIPSHANKLHINFKSDMTKSAKGFKIRWEETATGCGGTINSPTGSITSPGYPEPYNVNTECLWKISVSAGSIIQVVFSDLDLEEQSDCTMDYIELLDGPSLNSKSLGKYCSVNPSFVRSTSNTMTVKFVSDLSRNGRGFQLQYTTMCNNTLTGFRGVIESPNFPNNYPNSVNCNWEIKVAERNKIHITFSHFDLEKVMTQTILGNDSDTNCVYDYVEILYIKPHHEFEDAGPFEKYGTYCGDKIPPLISLNSDNAKIHFVTDNLLDGNGFRLEWQIEGCGDILTRPSGTITSPNYPRAYPASIECNWQIQVDYGSHVEITFPKMELEQTHICSLDYIKLFNGEDDTYPEIANICYQSKPITLRSSGNFMFVKFKADSSVQGLGFQANYTSLPTKCGGKYVADKARIMSPNYPNNYDKNDTCSYLIEVGEGHMIKLEFEDFDLYEPTEDCFSNNQSYVKVYDGPTVDYPVLVKICGKDAPNGTLTSTTNTMYVEMVTNTDMVAKGFLANYRKACGARIETEGTGIIKINTHDIGYDETNCSWTIVSKDLTKHVNLIVTHLDTLSTYCDEADKPFKVFNGESASAPLLGGYCGNKLPPTLTSDGAAMHVVVDYSSILFATYTVYDNVCGGTLTSMEGYFASPGYPKKYPMETECEWTIHVEEGNHVSLNFIYFELLKSEHCNTDYLEIRQRNGTGKLLGTFCGNNLPDNITHAGSLWLLLKTSRVEGDVSTTTAKGFYAEYILIRDNELSGTSGRIVSPLYSQPYPLYGDFSWKITVNYGKRILLTVKQLYLEEGDGMCFSEIDVYDGSDSNAPSLGEICGSVPPDAMKTTSNVVFIKFSGYSTTRSATRFILEWLQLDTNVQNTLPKTKGCGSKDPIDLNSWKNFTVITSPGYPNGYDHNLNCEWTITTIAMNHLDIYFSEMNLQRSYGSVCYADYVEVFQKKINADWESILKTCHENVTTRSALTATNMVKIVFKSDRFLNGTGFSAMVSEDCGGTLTDPSGYIIYDNNTRVSYRRRHLRTCQWNITLRAGKTIKLEFLKFDIHHDKNQGCDNFLMVRNGGFPDSPILGDGKYCGVLAPFTLNTTSNSAYIKFFGFNEASDFTIRYGEISYECGGEIRLTRFANTTEISSPNYPNIPQPHTECFWRIIAPPGEVLRIDFIDRFDLKKTKECQKEYVEVRDGGTQHSKLIARFCSAPNSQFSSDNMLFVKFFTDIDDPSNGFKAKISLENCGGTIRDKRGQIQSPSFGKLQQYPTNANCIWHLLTPLDHNMKIKFKKIDLEEAENCTTVDHVKIYEMIEENGEINTFGYYCGKSIPDDVETSGNEAIVHFHTGKERKELGGFSLQFNSSFEECGGTIEASEGTIKSPGYPVPHKNFRRCRWFITVPRGRRVTLKIEDIDMDTRLRRSFMNGLSIYNYKHFTGYITTMSLSSTERVVRSTENTMFVFYWAGANAGRGFKAKFSSNEPSACEGDLNQNSGTINQPKASSYYCTYIRNKVSSESSTLALTIRTVTNVTTKNCNYNYGSIKITSEDKKISLATVCVPTNNVVVRSSLPNIKITAMQYRSANQINFTISFNTYQCGGIISNEMGTITSPGYPNKYSKSVECSWQLKLPKEQGILLTFNSLDLGSDCVKSYLDIYNGNSPMSPKIGRYCQNQLPVPIRSETNNLWIDYKFEQDSNGKGFSLKYEPIIEGCGGVFHDRNRIIQTPSYPKDYPNNVECLWELRSDEGYHIGLFFTSRFQIEESDNCENDFLELWDWRNGNWISLGRKCGREIPNSINSTSNRLKILFRSNERIGGQGFRARWEWNCGGHFYADNTERFIVSPGFPVAYKKNVHCQYNITANQTQFVNIKFYEFDLEGRGSQCKYDNVTISNMWHRGNIRYFPYYQQIFCGRKAPPDVRLGNTVYIQFMTDGYVQRTGFKFSYQLDNCGGNVESPTVVTSPIMNMTRTPGLYSGYMTCLWNVTAPPKKIVVVRFEKFNLAFRRNCFFDNVEIYDGPQNNRGKLIANLCGNLDNDPPVIRSNNNSLVMTLKTDRTGNQDGFRAEIFFADGPEAGCGGRLDLNKSTTIDAPSLADMDCAWNIYSPMGTVIKMHFSELNLPLTCGLTNHTLTSCSCGSLEARDGIYPKSDSMEKFCGIRSTNFARELTSSSNSVAIRLYTRGFVNKAFKITLTPVVSICGPVVLNVTKDIQTLTSPQYPNNYPSNLRCTWLLKGSGKFLVHFVDFELNEETNEHIVANVCGGDKLQIVDDADNHLFNPNFGSNVVMSGNRRLTTDFSRYSLISGIHQFCGKTNKPFDYYSHVSRLTLKFSSGSLGNKRGKGFKFEYHTAGCNRNYTSLESRIVNYVESDCYQTITVPDNYTISLFFQHFVFYHSPSCEKVGLEIRDGADGSANLIQKSCGYALPSPVFSTKNKLWIYTWNKMGSRLPANYDLVYTSSDQGQGCGGVLYNYKGRFSSPFHPLGYKGTTPCKWDIRVPIGMRVAINISPFDIEGDCKMNYLKVTTYTKEDSNDHIFCKNDNPAILYSNSHLLVEYQSSSQNDGTGWMAQFEAVSQ